jgi:hypothetical protein
MACSRTDPATQSPGCVDAVLRTWFGKPQETIRFQFSESAMRMNRREWISMTAAARPLFGGRSARPKVAAVVAEFTYRSHAHVILENFLEPYYFNGKLTESGMDVVSLYVDQVPRIATCRARRRKRTDSRSPRRLPRL